jgi:hypothetical protein
VEASVGVAPHLHQTLEAEDLEGVGQGRPPPGWSWWLFVPLFCTRLPLRRNPWLGSNRAVRTQRGLNAVHRLSARLKVGDLGDGDGALEAPKLRIVRTISARKTRVSPAAWDPTGVSTRARRRPSGPTLPARPQHRRLRLPRCPPSSRRRLAPAPFQEGLDRGAISAICKGSVLESQSAGSMPAPCRTIPLPSRRHAHHEGVLAPYSSNRSGRNWRAGTRWAPRQVEAVHKDAGRAIHAVKLDADPAPEIGGGDVETATVPTTLRSGTWDRPP